MALNDVDEVDKTFLRFVGTVGAILLLCVAGIGFGWVGIVLWGSGPTYLTWPERALVLAASLSSLAGAYLILRATGGLEAESDDHMTAPPRWWDPVAGAIVVVPCVFLAWENLRTGSNWYGAFAVVMTIVGLVGTFRAVRRFRASGDPSRLTSSERARILTYFAVMLFLTVNILPAGAWVMGTLTQIASVGVLATYMWWTRLETSGPK